MTYVPNEVGRRAADDSFDSRRALVTYPAPVVLDSSSTPRHPWRLPIWSSEEFVDVATQDEMIAAFLRAEIDSDRFGTSIRLALQMVGAPELVIRMPDTVDAQENRLRALILTGYRGWDQDKYLFQGFPRNVAWRHVIVEPDDHPNIRYANSRDWVETVGGGSRSPRLGALRIRDGRVPAAVAARVRAVADQVRAGIKVVSPILLGSSTDDLVVVEGNLRITALHFAADPPPECEAIVGTAEESALQRWRYY
jgi:hypothetical protein